MNNFSDNFNFEYLYKKYSHNPTLLDRLKLLVKNYVRYDVGDYKKLYRKNITYYVMNGYVELEEEDEFLVINNAQQQEYPNCVKSNFIFWNRPYFLTYIVNMDDITVCVWYKDDLRITSKVEKWMKERNITYENFSEEDHFYLKLEWKNF